MAARGPQNGEKKEKKKKKKEKKKITFWNENISLKLPISGPEVVRPFSPTAVLRKNSGPSGTLWIL